MLPVSKTNYLKYLKYLFVFCAILPVWGSLLACRTVQPMPTVDGVNLERFMGDWFVIAHIPTSIEKTAHNALESYSLSEDRTVATTFSFNAGTPDGPRKIYKARGFIRDQGTNAIWGMQFIWPFKAEYRIIYLEEDYSITIIGRSKRDYLWIMARDPVISASDYNRLIDFVAKQGYEIDKVRRVPQMEGLLNQGN